MAVRERLSGNEAVAYAIKQINPDVMPAFPITPSTEIPQYVANYIANGEIDTEFIPVESEHSSMSATVGRGQSPHGHFLLRSGSDVGGAVCGGLQQTACGACPGESCPVRPDQYQCGPFRQYGSQRQRVDTDLCGVQPGGL